MINLTKLLWFAQRPRLYSELIRRLQRRIQSTLNPSQVTHTAEARTLIKQQATAWCEQYAVDTKTALYTIAGIPAFEPFNEQFREQIKFAEQRVKQSPVNMGGGGNLDLIYQLSEYCQATKVIETGVSYGWSSLVFLLSLRQREGACLISTDLPYAFKDSEHYVGCAVSEELRIYWKILSYADRESLPMALSLLPVIDMCHYDSDKSYEGRQWAYPKLWNALRSGGIFVSDDIDDDFGFRDFCQLIGKEPLIVKTTIPSGVKYVGVLVK